MLSSYLQVHLFSKCGFFQCASESIPNVAHIHTHSNMFRTNVIYFHSKLYACFLERVEKSHTYWTNAVLVFSCKFMKKINDSLVYVGACSNFARMLCDLRKHSNQIVCWSNLLAMWWRFLARQHRGITLDFHFDYDFSPIFIWTQREIFQAIHNDSQRK